MVGQARRLCWQKSRPASKDTPERDGEPFLEVHDDVVLRDGVLHRRLKKIIGQVQAIDRMVDEDVPCEDVLAQINAAKSALHKVGQVVLEGHINHCVMPT